MNFSFNSISHELFEIPAYVPLLYEEANATYYLLKIWCITLSNFLWLIQMFDMTPSPNMFGEREDNKWAILLKVVLEHKKANQTKQCFMMNEQHHGFRKKKNYEDWTNNHLYLLQISWLLYFSKSWSLAIVSLQQIYLSLTYDFSHCSKKMSQLLFYILIRWEEAIGHAHSKSNDN